MIRSLNQTEEKVRPSSPDTSQPRSWQEELRESIRCPHELCQVLGISKKELPLGESGGEEFPLIAPRGFVARMKYGDPRDPLLLQVLPQIVENQRHPAAKDDAVGDLAATIAPGVVKKYQGRALLIASSACAVHCRYCFRRNFPYDEALNGRANWSPALEAISRDNTIKEVILSGGDPLSLADDLLSHQIAEIARIPHLERLRIHTRFPIVIPRRITPELARSVQESRLTVIVVVHANHANELSEDVGKALKCLREAGAILYNQSVLLRGVNDEAQALIDLSERLLDFGVAPYYLHKLDHVTGASHFRTPDGLGESLVEAMRTRLPGYAVPAYVEEVPGMPYKIPLT